MSKVGAALAVNPTAAGRVGEGLRSALSWLGGRKMVRVGDLPKPSFHTLNALGEETATLAENRGLLHRLFDRPNVHYQDRLLGGVPGGLIGNKVENATASDDSSPTTRTLRKLLFVGGGAYGGGRAVNAAGNVARRYVANTSPLQGYSTQSLPKLTLKGLWQHGVKDLPGKASVGPEGMVNPRYELFRRYLGIHRNDPLKDYFVPRADGTLGFNPRTTGKGTPFQKHYIEPALKDPQLAATFRRPEPPRSTPPPLKPAPSKPSLLVSGEEPAGPRRSLLLSGPQTQPSRSLVLPPGLQAETTAPATTAATAPGAIMPPPLRPNLEALQQGVPYHTASSKNPFSALFGSHDLRAVPGSARITPRGAAVQHELGDVWNFAIDPHEAPELRSYLGGLFRTSPTRWREFLEQPATLGHTDAFTGFGGEAGPTVGERLKQYVSRWLTEKFLRQQTPVVRQRMHLHYDRPSELLSHGRDTIPVPPARAFFTRTERPAI